MATPRALPAEEEVSPLAQTGAAGYEPGTAESWCDADGECDPEAGGDGQGGHSPYFNDMWKEVHSHRRFYVQADYVAAWVKGNHLPPLVTTSPPGTPQAQAGVLPESVNTTILFGNQNVDTQRRNGERINVGYWLSDGELTAVEGQYFTLQQANTTFNASSDMYPILARPFVNYNPILPNPTEDAALIAYPFPFFLFDSPGTLTGSVKVQTTSNLQSANALLRRLIWIDFTTNRRLDVVLGYRFFRFDDSVTINDNFTYTPSDGGFLPTTNFTSQDQFSARNQFHGGEIGLKGQSIHGRWALEFLTKVAFGNNDEQVYINGSNTVTSLGTTVTGVGGLLTQPTNIGTYRRDVFAILPEADFNVRYDITRNLRATLGYTFMYMNRVQRSGDAIDRGLNPTQIGGTLVGDARPAFAFHDTGIWMHAATAGFEYRW